MDDRTSARRGETSYSPQAAFAELGMLLLDDERSMTDVLQRVATLARGTVPGAAEVSVTLMDGDEAWTASFTGEVAAALDERQYRAGSGPCMAAALTGQTVLVRDTADEHLYPEFARAARERGITSSLSVGLPIPQRTAGAINMYAVDAAPFDDDAREVAAAFAGYAAVAMVNAAMSEGALRQAREMQEASRARALLEQAKGILLRDNRCSPEEAFAMLVTASNRTHRRLRELAGSIVEGAATGG